MIPSTPRSMRASMAVLVGLLAIAILPLPGSRARSIVRQLRTLEPNRTDRDAHAGGYYVGLIEGGPDSGRDELTMRLLGKTGDWKTFHDVDATQYLRGDPLQFELKPNVHETIFGSAFTTNDQGLRDRPYSLEKPSETFRIVLLGSSMDMGWGVGTDETYENRLENWLNAHAAKRGLKRRFEVLNFAMAAYSPIHRLESFRRKALKYQPDLVLYSATMLDARLLEIHVRNLLIEGIDPGFAYLREALTNIDASPADIKADKDVLKAKVRPHLNAISDATLAELAKRCKSERLPLAMIVVPRVGQSDSPENRGPSVAKLDTTARTLGIPMLDLTATFDDRDPAKIEIAAWDDHPNATGHKLLFQALAHKLVDDDVMYRLLFNVDPPYGGRGPSQ